MRSFEAATALAGFGDVGLAYARNGAQAVVGGRLFAFLPDYFTGRRRLWASDGTPSGTYAVQEWNPSGDNLTQSITVLDGSLYFGVDDGATVDPWRCAAE